MRAHYLQHVPFEGLGSIEKWLRDNQYKISATHLYQSADFPDAKDIDLLIIMGGPMSVNDETDLPWLVAEKQFVKKIIEAGKPVLGICLGAQMIANALGEKVYPNSKKEIGWFPIQNASADRSLFQFPESATVFHWHGETFDLPREAKLLASSQACVNQAFQIGKNVIGLQFHLETTSESLADIAEHCSGDLIEGEYIQSVDKMKLVGEKQFIDINLLMSRVLNFLVVK